MSISVVIADPQPLVAAGIRQLLAAEPGFAVVATCRHSDEALRVVRETRPDILVVELRLNGGTPGLAVHASIRDEALPTRTVVYTAKLSDQEAQEALRLGVQGVILKDMDPQQLVRCIRKVHAGQKWIEMQSFGRALEGILQRESGMQEVADLLSQREIEIVRLAAAGRRNKQIARTLEITEGTVKVHLHSIYEKLKLEGRVALSRFAHDRGLI